MKKYHFILLSLLVLMNFSCYTFKVFPIEYRKLENLNVKKNAYVINDSLKKEFKIIKASNIFNIVVDSSNADLKIKLYPISRSWTCGQPLTLSMITVGQLPVYLPDRYYFKFDEINNDDIIEKNIELKIAQRFWFWDMFVFNKRFEEKAGKVLLGVYMNKEFLE